MWLGKMFGSTMGFFTGGPVGALFGMALGAKLDDHWQKILHTPWAPHPTAFTRPSQHQMNDAIFISLGYIAKSSGTILKSDIAYADKVMDHLTLTEEARQRARAAFHLGKQGQQPLTSALNDLRHSAFTLTQPMGILLGAALETTYRHPELTVTREPACRFVCRTLGVTERQFEQLKAHYHQQGAPRHTTTDLSLAEAARILGITHPAAPADIKRAYRRKMSQHHPDKLIATGASEIHLQHAKEQSQRIQSAYDLLKSARC